MNLVTLGIRIDSSDTARAKGELGGLTSAAGSAERATERLGTSQAAAGVKARTFANQNRLAAGQVGNLTAQLNDIGVMLAAGQSPLQLAIQQGTQINQVFGQMGGGRQALRGIGQAALSMVSPINLATLGIIAGGAALTQFAIEAFSAEDAASDFEKAMDRLDDISSALKVSLDDLALSQGELNELYTIGAENASQLIQKQAEFRFATMAEELSVFAVSLSEVTERYRILAGSTGQRVENVLRRISKEFGISGDAASAFEQAFTDAVSAKDTDQTIEALQKIGFLMDQYGVAAEDLPPELAKGVLKALELADATDRARAVAQDVLDTVDQLPGAYAAAAREAAALAEATLFALSFDAMRGFEEEILGGIEDANKAIERAQARASRSARSAANSRKSEAREIERRLKAQEDALLRQVQQHVLIEESVKRTADFWADVYEDVAENLKDLDDRLNGPARDAARTFVEGLTTGDLDSAFKELGRRAGAEFIDTLFGEDGKSFGGAFTSITSGLKGVAAGVQGVVNSIGGLLSGATGLSQAFAGIGGALSGIGGSIAAALGPIGAIVGGVLSVVNLIGSFSKTKVIGAGILGELGPDTQAFDFVRKKKSSFFGLTSSKSTKRDVNRRATNVLADARNIVLQEVEALADGLGGSARDVSGIVQKFRIDTRDMSTEEVERVLTAEIEKYQDRIALAALGTRKFTKLGESSSETLTRLSNSLAAFNSVAELLGTNTLFLTLRQAGDAADILESVGGVNAFSAAADTYFTSFLDLDEQIKQLSESLVERSTDLGLTPADIDTREELAAFVNSRGEGTVGARAQAGAISLAPLVDQIERLKEASAAAEQAIADQAAAEDLARYEQDLAFYQRYLLAAGREEELREIQLRGLNDYQKNVQRAIWQIEDQAAATEKAAQAEQELADARRDALSSIENFEFATGYDERRARSDVLAGRDVFSDYRDPQERTVNEVKLLRDEVAIMASSMRIVAANTGKTADNTADSVALAASA